MDELGMRIDSVRIVGFRCLKDVTLELSQYSSFIGGNDMGKSAALRCLCLLFDPATRVSETDLCSFSDDETERYIEAELAGFDHHPFVDKDGRVRVRRDLADPPAWKRMGDAPESDFLAGMQEGKLPRNQISGSKLPDKVRSRLEALIAERHPDGRIPPDVSRDIYRQLDDEGLVPKQRGWVPMKQDELARLVCPLFLDADLRVQENLADRGDSLFSRLGGVLFEMAASQHPGLSKAHQALQTAIDDFATSGATTLCHQLESYIAAECGAIARNVEVDVQLTPPSMQALRFGSSVEVSDQACRGILQMGHGLRRSVIFAMLRAIRRLRLDEQKRNSGATGLPAVPSAEDDSAQAPEPIQPQPLFLFLIEEPELYLHPQAERERMQELEELAAQPGCQVVLCTHSAFFVNLNDLGGIVRFERQGRDAPTQVRQWQGDPLSDKDKEDFKIIQAFDPTAAAALFARHVILVEGQTEKMILPILAKRIDAFEPGVEIVDCGGNGQIPQYQRVLEGLGIQYVAWFDSKERQAVENGTAAKGDYGRLVLSKHNWETMAQVKPKDGESKPYASYRHFVVEGKGPNDTVCSAVRAAYGWEDFDPTA